MTERMFNNLASRRLTRRSIIISLAVTAVGTAIVSCSGASTSPTPAAAAPTAAPAAAAATPTAAAPTAAPAAASATPQPATATAPAAPAATAPVIIKMNDQFKFDPASVTIPKGTTVEWQGVGTQPHTVTFDPAKAMDKSHVVLPGGVTPFDSGLVNPGASYKHTFTVVGVYHYICIPHEAMGMLGTITVT